MKNVPKDDVFTATSRNFTMLLGIVLECYFEFGTAVDPHQYYTKANFDHIGKTVDDADEELMGIRGYTDIEDWPEAYRWQAHRNQLNGCKIDHLFIKYLGKSKPWPPKLPDDPTDFAGEYWVPPCLIGPKQ